MILRKIVRKLKQKERTCSFFNSYDLTMKKGPDGKKTRGDEQTGNVRKIPRVIIPKTYPPVGVP